MTDTSPVTDEHVTDGGTGAGAAGAAARPETLWHNEETPKLWLGETISLFGTQVTNLALPLTAVLVFNASPVQVGLLRGSFNSCPTWASRWCSAHGWTRGAAGRS